MAKKKRHSPEQIVAKLRDADVMLNTGKDLAAVLQTLEVSEQTYYRWRNQYGGMKSEEAKRCFADLKCLQDLTYALARSQHRIRIAKLLDDLLTRMSNSLLPTHESPPALDGPGKLS